jgi:hypothetical protein
MGRVSRNSLIICCCFVFDTKTDVEFEIGVLFVI